MAKILIVDDEPKLGRVLVEMLEGAGHAVSRAGGGREALAALEGGKLDVIVTDLKMPDVDGMAVLRAARARAPNTDVVMMTAFATAQNAVEALTEGAVDYLIKPFAMDEFRLRIGRVVERRELSNRAATLAHQLDVREGFGRVTATTESMAAVVAQAKRVAATAETVLLLGESGTGKTLLARAIHHASKRAQGPLVELHAASLPQGAVDAELFGADAKPGLVESAAGGTLVLDEIAELPAATQARLLGLLNDRTFVRAGATRQADVRVMATTNRDLNAAVGAGTFREDLYYRLAVFPIVVPPLRDRPDDIRAIVTALLAHEGLGPDRITAPAMSALAAHSWPGNVRELENALTRALVLAGTEPIGVDHLPTLSRNALSMRTIDDLLTAGFSLDAHERDLIQTALVKAGGNKAAAARLLGITRRRLYSRLDSIAHGKLEPPDDDE